MTILITCETAGEAVVPRSSHGDPVDIGRVDACAGQLSRRMSDLLCAPYLQFEFRRGLIDARLSLGHRRLFGPVSAGWSKEEKQRLIDLAYLPYRDRVRSALRRILEQFSFVLHLSIRSFAAKHRGEYRRTDVGLLYDPAREAELNLCIDWIDELYEIYPDLRTRRNYPRRGTVDSLTKSFRGEFPADQYMGVEVWLNRAWAAREVRLRDQAVWHLADSLRVTLGLPAESGHERVA